MRSFTDEEFDVMVAELTDAHFPSFNMLCAIAEKTLRNSVRAWCASDEDLRGTDLEDDVMQEIFIRLIKTTLYGFLIRDDRGGGLNRDPDGFRSWMFEVARNIKNDFAAGVRRMKHRTRGFIDGEDDLIPDPRSDDYDEREYKRDRLAKAFDVVFGSDKKVYIVLTWLAQNLFVLEYGVTKIKSIRIMERTLSEKTLFEMRDIVFRCAVKTDWIRITPARKRTIDRALNAEYGGKALGEHKYKEFYMTKGGRRSISDWINRMNALIVRKK